MLSLQIQLYIRFFAFIQDVRGRKAAIRVGFQFEGRYSCIFAKACFIHICVYYFVLLGVFSKRSGKSNIFFGFTLPPFCIRNSSKTYDSESEKSRHSNIFYDQRRMVHWPNQHYPLVQLSTLQWYTMTMSQWISHIFLSCICACSNALALHL